MFICANCGKELKIDGKVARDDICPYCHAYLHSCLNCKFYAPGYHNDCREAQAEYVRDKRTSNFCEYFVFKEVKQRGSRQGGVVGKGKTIDPKEAFRKLFGD